jgi:hypothetical protein
MPRSRGACRTRSSRAAAAPRPLATPDWVRVAPGDPLRSYLYAKVPRDAAIEGSRMPAGAYEPEVDELVHAWIEAGAPLE